jgi:hypothetical protein
MGHCDSSVTLNVLELSGHLNDSQRHSRGTYLLYINVVCLHMCDNNMWIYLIKKGNIATHANVEKVVTCSWKMAILSKKD